MIRKNILEKIIGSYPKYRQRLFFTLAIAPTMVCQRMKNFPIPVRFGTDASDFLFTEGKVSRKIFIRETFCGILSLRVSGIWQ